MEEISRRSFLKKTAILGAGTVLGESILGRVTRSAPGEAFAENMRPDIVSVKGKDYFANTLKAVTELGGIETLVRRGDRIGLLVNSPFKNPGASVRPDIVLALIQMCHDAGCKEIRYLKEPHRGYWERTALAGKYDDLIRSLKYESGGYSKIDIPGGIALKDARVSKDLFDCDVFINIFIAKHHEGVHYTGALKNMMGLCPFTTNSYFHLGTLKMGWYGDVDHLSQCIADLNLVRKPDLCIADSTLFIMEKGPYGPGKLANPEMVVASLNSVSADAFCCEQLGLKAEEVLMIRKASKHGLGQMDLQKVRIQALTS